MTKFKISPKLTGGAWEQAHMGHLKMADKDLEGLIRYYFFRDFEYVQI